MAYTFLRWNWVIFIRRSQQLAPVRGHRKDQCVAYLLLFFSLFFFQRLKLPTFIDWALDDVHAAVDVALHELGGVGRVGEEHLAGGVVQAKVGHILEGA